MLDFMDAKDWVMVAAVIAGPILAVQAQRLVESYRQKKERRLRLFHTLMANRATRLSLEHVNALNMIDIEFYGKKFIFVRYQTPKEKSVTNAWKNCNDHLNEPYTPEQLPAWLDRQDRLFTALLYNMSLALGYDFDEVQLKRDCYRPAGHGDIERENFEIRSALLNILNGTSAIPIKHFQDVISRTDKGADKGSGVDIAGS